MVRIVNEYLTEEFRSNTENRETQVVYSYLDNRWATDISGAIIVRDIHCYTFSLDGDGMIDIVPTASFLANKKLQKDFKIKVGTYFRGCFVFYWERCNREHFLAVSYNYSDTFHEKVPELSNWLQEGF